MKIAVTPPEELLDAAERARLASGETRSAIVRRALAELLEEVETGADAESAGYLAHPATEEEVALARVTARRVLAEIPWV